MALSTMPFGSPFLGGKVEQHGVDAGVGQVRRDLGAHDAGTQDGGTTYK